MCDDAVPLGDGRYEEKVPVDRKKLEAMITGRPSPEDQTPLPTAEHFFEQVTCYSGARVFWPSQLKIGAKTKRDPFVKVQGTMDQIELAKTYISSLLQAKKERVTLKMDINHSIHAHIIGKGGKSIQQIMRSARCHIHFPDSNKFSEPNTKSDQVSVTGAPQLIDNARRILRFISPIVLSTEVPLVTSSPPPSLAFKENISWQQMSASSYMVFIRENSGELDNLRRMVQIVAAQFSLPSSYPLLMTTSLNLKEDVLQLINSTERDMLTSLRDVHVSIHDSLAVISGKLDDVIKMRTKIIGLCGISLSFEVNAGQAFSSCTEVQKKYKIIASTKKKANHPHMLTITLKSTENRITELLEARDFVLGNPGQDYPTNEYTNFSRKVESPPHFLSSIELPSFSMMPSSDMPKSPDPEDSPLAASILKGIKDMEQKSGSWSKKPTLGREDLIRKAALAVFDDSGSNQGTPRYPTDQWAGYGFSSSLPAELLKGLLDVSASNSESAMLNRRIDSKTPPSRGLYSLREEDELSDFTGSFNSQAGQSRNFERAPRRTAFSASTSIFDASPVSQEFSWDIRSCSDPAMVLAQLGCSEYLPQMREQEIDMHAFLLLDEQNLKDIGVSTIGARKKIHHAIIKLRESARRNGFAI